MNRFVVISTLVLYATLICISCDKESKVGNVNCQCFERADSTDEEKFVGIENISFENYPKVDGSTSARALNMVVACKLLNLRYAWSGGVGGIEEWSAAPYQEESIPEDFFGERIKTSQTNGAFMNLIDGDVDIILTHRTISPDEKTHADNAGVTLIETPIALDAFVFIVNRTNKVKSLSVSQVQGIYTKRITNWSQVGGKNVNIQALTRPRNSGSEEVFREVVMNGLKPAEFSPPYVINPMWVLLDIIINNENSIGYTFYNYKEVIARKSCNEVPVLAINGICPDENMVKNGKYPFISKVHVAIRSDLDHNSVAYKLYEWLQSENAAHTIAECGFIPKQ